MTRDEVIATNDGLRESIADILHRASHNSGSTDTKHAARAMGLLTHGKILMPESIFFEAMLEDLATFERNASGIRPYDRFLAGPARALPEEQRDLAGKIGGAFYSLFKFVEKHEKTSKT